MKKVIRISENNLVDLIKKTINEDKEEKMGSMLQGLLNTIFKSSDLESSKNKDGDDDTNGSNDDGKKVPSKTTSDDDFYKKVLDCLGAKPTKGNMDFMYAWRQAEAGRANFNPFNTTKKMPDTTNYNSVGVKNYKSVEDGIKATCDTLKLGYYTDIVNGLKNDVGLSKLSKMPSLKIWGTGPLLAKVADSYLAGNTPKPPAINVA
jgi:hypothetical protein